MVDENNISRSIFDEMLSNRGLKTTLADLEPAALEVLQHAASGQELVAN